MTIYAFAYLFIALATFISVTDTCSKHELIASAIVGLSWPLFISVRVIQKITR